MHETCAPSGGTANSAPREYYSECRGCEYPADEALRPPSQATYSRGTHAYSGGTIALLRDYPPSSPSARRRAREHPRAPEYALPNRLLPSALTPVRLRRTTVHCAVSTQRGRPDPKRTKAQQSKGLKKSVRPFRSVRVLPACGQGGQGEAEGAALTSHSSGRHAHLCNGQPTCTQRCVHTPIYVDGYLYTHR